MKRRKSRETERENKLCKKPGDYAFSSYADYLTESTAVDTAFALQLLPCDEFIRYNNVLNSDSCMEIAEPARRAVTDAQAKKLSKESRAAG